MAGFGVARLLLWTITLWASGCTPEISFPELSSVAVQTVTACAPSMREFDVVFVIDDSPSMAERQRWLGEGFRQIAAGHVLTPTSLRVAFVTTDVGNPSCDASTRKDGELLLSSCRERLDDFTIGSGYEHDPADARDACLELCSLDRLELRPTTTTLDPTPRPRPWIEIEIERRGSSVELGMGDSSDPGDVLACAAMRGNAGCEHEAPLEALRRALERMHDASDPAYGFLRRSAHLVIVIITDEDDCSVQDASAFDPNGARALWPDPEASRPPSALCVHAGIECSGPDDALVCSTIHRDSTGRITDDPGAAVLQPVDTSHALLDGIMAAKDGDRRLYVELVAGFQWTGQLDLQLARSEGPFVDEHGYAPGCDGPPPAASPVRLLEWSKVISTREPSTLSACAPPQFLESTAELLIDRTRPLCFTECAADLEPDDAALEPSCTVIEVDPDGFRRTLPRCLNASDDPTIPPDAEACWVALTGGELSPYCREHGWNLEIQLYRGPRGATPDSCLEITCEVSTTPTIDCPDRP
jgi:hypothetical protein